jgi:hypothetical protein
MLKRTSRSFLAVALLVGLLAAGAAGQGQGASGGPFDELGPAIAAQERHTERLLSTRDVVGTGVGFGADGEPAVLIFTKGPGVAGLPAALDGVPVVVRVTGEFISLHHKDGHNKGGGNDTTTTTPTTLPSGGTEAVPIGVSTGNVGECSSGTIGARVKNAGGQVFALSNNHVYALEDKALIGSEVLSPGRYDTGCVIDPANVIGRLFAFVPIHDGGNKTIDAAIALSSTVLLGRATPADGYGTPKTAIAAAFVGQAAQKYGRTTSLTKGTITAINVIVNVGYSGGTVTFVDQIIFEGTKPVIKAGDSGSLLVTDPGRYPVGLLFAGNRSGKLGVANPIDLVLDAFGVTIDGE